MITENEILQILENRRHMKRNHASYFDWHDKQVKESGIVDEFLDPENHKGKHDYVSFSIPDTDPPDAVIYKNDDEEAQLEITELVNQKAIESQIYNDPSYSSECLKWSKLGYFETQLNKCIQTKNKKCTALFNQHENVQLLLHTDEEWIEASYKKHFNAGITIQPHRFSDIWLMLSYSTGTKSYPIIRVCEYVKNID